MAQVPDEEITGDRIDGDDGALSASIILSISTMGDLTDDEVASLVPVLRFADRRRWDCKSRSSDDC